MAKALIYALVTLALIIGSSPMALGVQANDVTCESTIFRTVGSGISFQVPANSDYTYYWTITGGGITPVHDSDNQLSWQVPVGATVGTTYTIQVDVANKNDASCIDTCKIYITVIPGDDCCMISPGTMCEGHSATGTYGFDCGIAGLYAAFLINDQIVGTGPGTATGWSYIKTWTGSPVGTYSMKTALYTTPQTVGNGIGTPVQVCGPHNFIIYDTPDVPTIAVS